MAIRTLVVAAALAAFTTPALADNGENIAILDDTVSTGTFAFNVLPALFVGIAGTALAMQESNETPSTN